MVKHILDKDTFSVRFTEESKIKRVGWVGLKHLSWVQTNSNISSVQIGYSLVKH